MFSLVLHPPAEEEDYLIAELADSGVAGITEEPGALRAFFEDCIDRDALLERFARYRPSLEQVEPVDWTRVTREAWPPLEIGRRFYLVAPWWDCETPEGRIRLVIEPGMACGTGRHPATQLCLEAMEKHLVRGSSVLDVGTGSGILAQAAVLLEAGSVMACDVDREAVAIARLRPGPRFFVGSIDAVRARSQDLIIANIDSATLETLAPEIERVRKPDSRLILSGFPEWDAPETFARIEILRRQEWACLVC